LYLLESTYNKILDFPAKFFKQSDVKQHFFTKSFQPIALLLKSETLLN